MEDDQDLVFRRKKNIGDRIRRHSFTIEKKIAIVKTITTKTCKERWKIGR